MSLKSKVLSACLLEDAQMSFEVPIDRKHMYVYIDSPQEAVDTEVYGGYVKWSLELDVRSWGVKDVVPKIDSFWIEGAHELDGGGSTPFSVRYPYVAPRLGHTLDPQDYEDPLPWNVEVKLERGSGIAIYEVTVDFVNRLFTASFE